MECIDFLEFQEQLKRMRELDDKLIYALNVNVPTPSFRGEINPARNCEQLYADLRKSYDDREASIRHCIDISSQRVKELKAKRNETDDAGVKKLLNNEQTKLRLMKSELLVEEVVKDRSLKVYYERCREYYKPPNIKL